MTVSQPVTSKTPNVSLLWRARHPVRWSLLERWCQSARRWHLDTTTSVTALLSNLQRQTGTVQSLLFQLAVLECECFYSQACSQTKKSSTRLPACGAQPGRMAAVSWPKSACHFAGRMFWVAQHCSWDVLGFALFALSSPSWSLYTLKCSCKLSRLAIDIAVSNKLNKAVVPRQKSQRRAYPAAYWN